MQRVGDRRQRWRAALVLGPILCLSLTACASRDQVAVSGGDEASSSCVLAVRFRGHTYLGYRPAILPIKGQVLGTGIVPPCDDTNDGVSDSPEDIQVAELPGVSPDVAVIWIGSETILVREDVDPLPPQIAELMSPPDCLSADEPIEISGQWRGILGADGKTELDLLPPYDIDMFVTSASAPRYERAFLTVRVPTSLGTPISKDDIRSSLWEGGQIAITATCDTALFVAMDVEASSPM